MSKSSEAKIDLEFDAYEEFRSLSDGEATLYEKKNRDYAGDGPPFGNFERVADILSNYPKLNPAQPIFVVLMGMLKQFDCILDAVANERELEVESLPSRFRDISVYAKIGSMILDPIASERLDESEEENEEDEDNGEEDEENDSGDEEVSEEETEDEIEDEFVNKSDYDTEKKDRKSYRTTDYEKREKGDKEVTKKRGSYKKKGAKTTRGRGRK